MWREHRKQIMPHLEKLEREVLAEINQDEIPLPPEIHFPRYHIEANLSRFFRSNPALLEEAGDPVQAMTSLFQIFLTWRREKVIYNVDPVLYSALKQARLPDSTPFSCVRLPRRALLLDLPERPPVFCFYDCLGLDGIADDGSSELFLVMAEVTLAKPHPSVRVWNLDANCPDLNGYLDQRLKRVRTNAPPHVSDEKTYQAELTEFVRPILNILAYINGEEDVVQLVHPGIKPDRITQNREKRRRLEDIATPAVFSVGRNFKAVIERWEIENEVKEGSGAGRSPRPHIRSAHPHLYWTGEGRKEPKIRFLPPIPILGGRDEGEPTEPKITIVK